MRPPGFLYGKRRVLPEAFAAFRHAYSIAQQNGDRSQIGHLLHLAGETLYANGHTQSACLALNAALREFSALKLCDANQIRARLVEISVPIKGPAEPTVDDAAFIDSIFAVF